MSTIIKTSTTHIAADADTVWEALDEGFLDVSEWAGGVTSSKANPETPAGFNGSQHGGRICEVEGIGTTDERIVDFDRTGRRMGYSIAAKGLPFFVKSMKNTWTVRPDGPTGSVVEVEIEAVTKGIMGAIGAIPMGRMLAKGAAGLPADLQTYLEARN